MLDREIIRNLIEKYETSLPRYTSYPTAPQWQLEGGDFVPELIRKSVTEASNLSLYIHVPFCENRCLFCGCNTIISKDRNRATHYLKQMAKEIDHIAALRSKYVHDSSSGSLHGQVKQLHFGGGTPTFLNSEQFRFLNTKIRDNFPLANATELEFSIEIDPEVTTMEHLETAQEIGINRISIGVQDFNEDVLARINRPQSNDWISQLSQKGRELQFSGINIDLIFGLPGQNRDNFRFSLEKTVELMPDRIALFSYAHVPWIKSHQKSLEKFDILSGYAKFELFLDALDFFSQNGYEYIGLDHFARKGDSLALARQQHRMHRNFQGYTTQGDLDLFALGVSSISSSKYGYWQNPRDLEGYNQKIDQGLLPVIRGHVNSPEDMRRKNIILEILCHGRYQPQPGHSLDTDILGQTQEFDNLVNDGMIVPKELGFEITALGQLFLRNIASLFDSYLIEQKQQSDKKIYSKTI